MVRIPGVPHVIRDHLLGQLFAGLFLILLFSGLVAGFFYIGVEEQLDEQVETQVRETANLQSDIYSAWFDSRSADMREVRSNLRNQVDTDTTSTDLERDLQQEVLESSLAVNSEFTAFHLVDPSTGEILASSDEQVIGKSFDEDQFRASEFVTEQYESVTGETVIGIGDPLGTRMGEILVGEIEATEGGPEIRQTIDGSRTVVVTADGTPVLGPSGIETDLVSASLTEPVERDGYLVASEQLDNRLVVVTQSPTEEAFALQERVLQSFLLTLLVTFAVLSVVIGLGGRSVQKSLTRLGKRARQMEEGDLEVTFSTRKTDEIGDLYRSFGAMQRSLREQLDENKKARAQAEQFAEQLRVMGRLLRHNLRNNLSTIEIYAQKIEAGDSHAPKSDARRIQHQSSELLETADKQHTLTRLLSDRQRPQPHDINSWLDRTVARSISEYPETQISYTSSEAPQVLAIPKLGMAINELVENAIVHSDQQTPHIDIALRTTDEGVQIIISDDGPGIPKIEREVLGERTIDSLNHGSGIGLWLVFWIVKQSGGTLRFENGDSRGSTVIIELDRADSQC